MKHTTRTVANPKKLEHYFLIWREDINTNVIEYLRLKDNLGFAWNETKQVAWKLTPKEFKTHGMEVLTMYGEGGQYHDITRPLGMREVKDSPLTSLLDPKVNIYLEGL